MANICWSDVLWFISMLPRLSDLIPMFCSPLKLEKPGIISDIALANTFSNGLLVNKQDIKLKIYGNLIHMSVQYCVVNDAVLL